VIRGLVALVGVSLAACSLPEAPPPPAFFSLFDVKALYDAGQGPEYRLAAESSLPGGIPIKQLMSADGALTVHPTFADGYNAAYVVTEIWTDFDELWVQPAYIPVTGWSSGRRDTLTTPWQPIFSVGPGSRFYSPFWQIIFVEVPDGTSPDALTSAEQVLNSGYPLHPELGRVMVMYPDQVTLADPMTPGLVTEVGGAMEREGWVDGARGTYLEFQSADLRWNDQLVIDEVPIYHFVARADDGSLVQLPIPTVAGTGPPYSNTPTPAFDNPPGSETAFTSHYAGYWRLYTVILPPDARVFAPPARMDVTMALQTEAPQFPLYPQYAPDIAQATADQLPMAGMVALAPTCFEAGLGAIPTDNNPSSCLWLDSQQHIEAYLNPALIQRTNVTVTCPFVSFRGEEVKP
jgi:hypothetical protein